MIKTLFAVALAALTACSSCKRSADNAGETPDRTDSKPLITDKGTPTGGEHTYLVNPDGTTIVTEDNTLTLRFPAGAVSTPTTITVQPVSNLVPLGLGNAVRLSPEGTTFAKPVTLSFHYNADMLQGAVPEFLWVTTQNADGSWSASRKSEVDTVAKTVTVQATHFSDWAMGRFIDLTLMPASRALPVNQSVTLFISGFLKDADPDEELVPLSPMKGTITQLDMEKELVEKTQRFVNFRIGAWTLNGTAAPVSNSDGSLNPSVDGAVFTAPAKQPSPSTVAVAVKMETHAAGMAAVHFQLVSNITIVESEYYLSLRVDGREYHYIQWGLNGKYPEDPNHFAGVNCGRHDDGSIGIAGTAMDNGRVSASFVFKFGKPAVGSRLLECIYSNSDTQDDMGFNPLATTYQQGYLNAYTERVRKPDYCDEKDKCPDIAFRLTEYSGGSEPVVAGTFTGTLYEDRQEFKDNCKTPLKHTVSGEFKLKAVN